MRTEEIEAKRITDMNLELLKTKSKYQIDCGSKMIPERPNIELYSFIVRHTSGRTYAVVATSPHNHYGNLWLEFRSMFVGGGGRRNAGACAIDARDAVQKVFMKAYGLSDYEELGDYIDAQLEDMGFDSMHKYNQFMDDSQCKRERTSKLSLRILDEDNTEYVVGIQFPGTCFLRAATPESTIDVTDMIYNGLDGANFPRTVKMQKGEELKERISKNISSYCERSSP